VARCAYRGEGLLYRLLVVKPEERDHLEGEGVDWRIILRWIYRMCDMGLWTGSSWFRIGTGGRHL